MGDHSPLFQLHSIIGLTIMTFVMMRIVWGFAGRRFARFDLFAFEPGAVMGHKKGVLTGRGRRRRGHNPGASRGIFLKLALVLVMAAMGLAMSFTVTGAKDFHEIASWVLIGVVVARVLGLMIHAIRFRENIIGSMIHGRKAAERGDGIRSGSPVAAAVMLVVAGAVGATSYAALDRATGRTTLPLLETSIKLWETEKFDGKREGGRTLGHGRRRHGWALNFAHVATFVR